eukprot:4263128-Ditylum_brightwellii.AAC.1
MQHSELTSPHIQPNLAVLSDNIVMTNLTQTNLMLDKQLEKSHKEMKWLKEALEIESEQEANNIFI